ncbi:NADPH-dependent 7-cyano-7-deazaguanine reductase QueF [Stenotrophomonas maltophilia]|jgi:7-cyano-7-deazaguanine reductase|uniref:NADPH-dependent 7-cyano-7-deazaguanine reductase QueF n=1 Tax=Stenotrophomonas TaxID=40323 RepID=UPI00201CE9A6|nr:MULTISPECIES: NADPH-dependent 7-cyano-7-deazaguanine reductase QueF [Stenotrophomonas]MBN5025045.1 NADPH-dependent 7-cyano-7-deazaguanine reductase QueF [Stenotrophomonas maltophilia]MDH1271999.1 NADPH-dependent 7-cyano-7-deazaguanine reductase QueF [Stenotrophomonas sp. GD03937]MDH1484001.1 NADPH-dependent 7-cyano-7-deazaguanine reductase QueF [Stenotrophomonas sp. GD03712]MDR2960233.1 NADPH-dependent 7-cyano-7-deazaguanine reductase QueF [Stenotrophomonas sp.]UQY94909.1 NADPH-dependent 7-
MNTPQDSSLGREVSYPSQYDPGLLFPIPRSGARAEIGLDDTALPFVGHDRWHAFELSWLDPRGKPQVAVATVQVPCTSPRLIESKSFKLYLNSLNSTRIDSAEALRARIAADLSACAGAPVQVAFGLPELREAPLGESIDGLELEIDCYGPPQADFLAAAAGEVVEETLVSALLKSNCPVTGQPDWATVSLRYRGPKIDRAGLLRYLVSYREHAEFHEQCVERIFSEVSARCQPQWLEVEARYTRRGGLDINPWRASPGIAVPAATYRELRQ